MELTASEVTTLWRYKNLCIIIIYIIIIFKLTSTKPHVEILTLNKVNGCNEVSFGDHSVLEGDRIPPLKSHGQAFGRGTLFPWCPQ